MEDYCTAYDSIVQSVTFKSDHIIHPILSKALSQHVVEQIKKFGNLNLYCCLASNPQLPP